MRRVIEEANRIHHAAGRLRRIRLCGQGRAGNRHVIGSRGVGIVVGRIVGTTKPPAAQLSSGIALRDLVSRGQVRLKVLLSLEDSGPEFSLLPSGITSAGKSSPQIPLVSPINSRPDRKS